MVSGLTWFALQAMGLIPCLVVNINIFGDCD